MIYFTADTHFGRERLIREVRPSFLGVDEHDGHLLNRINSRVGRDDTLVILGDFGCPPGRYRHLIRCKHIFFILGNHDQEAKIRNVFGGNVWHQRMVKIMGGQVWCCHYPTAFWDGSHNGVYHAYGHIHNCPKHEAMMDLGMPGRRSMDVGVDSAKKKLGDYMPFSETELLFFMPDKGHDLIERE